MKHAMVALTLALLLIKTASAQQQKPFEPEYFSVFYYLRASGQAIELERQIPSYVSKGGRWLLEMPGDKSPVRLKAGSPMQFIARVSETFDQAVPTMQLLQFRAEHGMRQLPLNNITSAKSSNSLKLNIEKYGDSSVKVIPSQALGPGEYCVSRTTIPQGFCFGVDAGGNEQALFSEMGHEAPFRGGGRRRAEGLVSCRRSRGLVIYRPVTWRLAAVRSL